MYRTLGLDLGTNSLGWAILDDVTCDVLDKGVVVFPEGVDLDAGTSVETPAAVRRAARMARRMKFRRKLRKWNLLKLLITNGMCPLSAAELADWKNHGKYPLANGKFLEWLKSTDVSNPYGDRAAAASGKVEPYVLGRALYHICQRRGFKSSRKEEAGLIDDETGDVKKDDKKLGAVKSDIQALNDEIAAAGCATLGQYFFKRLQAEADNVCKTRIRCRYTGRVEHYEKEFAVIMAAQGLDAGAGLGRQLHQAIFYQRPLRSQKHLVGKCPLEPKSPRAQIGHPDFEEFRMWSFINNMSLENPEGEYRDADGNLLYPLTGEDRERIADAFYRAAANFKFSVISKLFKKDKRFAQGFKFHYYHDDDSLPSCRTRHLIRVNFGEVPYDEQKVYDALTFYNDNELLGKWFAKHYPSLNRVQIAKLVSIHPKEGNAQYSLKAIRKMLPFLRRGFDLSQARIFAKLPELVRNWDQNAEMVLAGLSEQLMNYRSDRRRFANLAPQLRKTTAKPALLFDRYRDCLVSNEWIAEGDWNQLYLRGDEEYVAETEYRCNGKTVKLAKPRLPKVELGMIRNPLVQRSMTTMRRLVNYLGDHGKIDETDTIRIELARSVNDFATRKALQEWQKGRQKLRDEAAVEIAKLRLAITDDAVERYLLWKEQGGKCLYTGKNIPLAELFSGNSFDIEHTLPRSLSGDDSLANKTICEAVYNRQVKKGMVPRSCPNWDEIDVMLRPWREQLERLEKDYRNQTRSASGKTDPGARSTARVKAMKTRFELNYWRDKLRRFDMTVDKLTVREGELSGFKKRQLVDSGIMSSHAVALLKSVYPATFAVNGAATAFARKAWGLQGDEAKDRSEHTHHAVDAMVIAALKPSRFTAICTALKDDGAVRYREAAVCPAPCEDFSEKVRSAAGEILVKHVLRQTTMRQSSKRNALARAHQSKSDPTKMVKAVLSRGDTVRGPLHEARYYGVIHNPHTQSQAVVKRIDVSGSIDELSKQVPDIVDPSVRSIVEEALSRMSRDGRKDVAPGEIKMASGVPIRHVRVVVAAKYQHPSKIKPHSHVSKHEYKRYLYAGSAPGVNFRMGVFSDGLRRWVEIDNKLAWAQNHKGNKYLPLDAKECFIGYVYPESMVIFRSFEKEDVTALSGSQLRDRLYSVVIVGGNDDLRAQFKLAHAAGMKKDLGKPLPSFDVKDPPKLLRMGPQKYLPFVMFENLDFKFAIDGTIKFL